MKEIAASTRVTGKRRIASVEAARRKVRDGGIYLIRRHGSFFRPDAHGYTTELAAAGVFDGATARRYLDVEGLSVVPARSLLPSARVQIDEAQMRLDGLRKFVSVAGASAAS
jgi:hypothetical protein